jgi:hypothetical protein
MSKFTLTHLEYMKLKGIAEMLGMELEYDEDGNLSQDMIAGFKAGGLLGKTTSLDKAVDVLSEVTKGTDISIRRK